MSTSAVRRRLKLLVLTPSFPYPPVSGGDIRVFHLLRRLSRVFDIHLLSQGGGSSERLIAETGIAVVHSYQQVEVRSLWSLAKRRIDFWRHAPHGIRLDVDPGYARTLKRIVAATSFDGVLIDHLYMMQYARFLGPLPVFYSATSKPRSLRAGTSVNGSR